MIIVIYIPVSGYACCTGVGDTGMNQDEYIQFLKQNAQQ
jgi:hypothetical protein